jgi:hypothetical protein
MKNSTLTIKLKPIDFSKATGHECPGVKTGKTRYLAVLQGNEMAIGSFSRQWYGLNFEGFYGAGLQFDAPGTNASRWKALFEIVVK